MQTKKCNTYGTYLGMKDINSYPTNHEKRQEKSQYGSDNKHISMWVVSSSIVEDDARKSFNKFTPPPCASKKESTSRNLRDLFGVGSRNIFLNTFRVKRTRFLT
jgi:hypothetical protein